MVALVDPDRLRGDAATACQDYLAAGGVVSPWPGCLAPPAGAVIVDGTLAAAGVHAHRRLDPLRHQAAPDIGGKPAGLLTRRMSSPPWRCMPAVLCQVVLL